MVGLRGFVLFVLLLAVGCGVSDPPLPSEPIRFPVVGEPSATTTPQPSAPAPSAKPSNGVATLTISVAPPTSDIPKYDRKDWRHWVDADGDCQDARQEALIAEAQTTIVYEARDECRVEAGSWFGVYTGESFDDPSDLDVDHMVPLANAHRSGGWAWSRERKAEYANDLSYPNHLIAVQAAANRQKGSKGPEKWRPPRSGYWCQYATDWATIKQTWGLTATQSEVEALREMLATCDKPPSLVTVDTAGAPMPPSAPIAATATPIQPAEGELRYDPNGPDRDCGDFETWDEAQAFFIAAGGRADDRHRLDGDEDGVACNSLRR